MGQPSPAPSAPAAKARDALELAWLERIREGDVQAFESLFLAYVESLCSFAYSYVRSHAAAQELVQELFCRLWERRQSLGMPRNVHAYLYGAVRNRAINYLRKQRVEDSFALKVIRRDDEQRTEPGALTEPEQTLDATELVAAIEQAVASMPVRCREVFTLIRDQGMTYAATAAMLQISPKTVETHMARALRLLRQRLAAWLP